MYALSSLILSLSLKMMLKKVKLSLRVPFVENKHMICDGADNFSGFPDGKMEFSLASPNNRTPVSCTPLFPIT